MREKLLNEKGISLISLSITVMIILIITGTIIYNVKDNLKVEKLQQMQQDIENLSNKIDTYYTQYGKIPAKFEAEYTNISEIEEAGVISQAVDTGRFYVIDLQAIENLTLTYGQDYENVKALTDSEQISQYTNLYIINEASHNIFYAQGIELDGEMFYTNYTAEDIETEAVKLHYVDNVKIPNGYNYVRGTRQSEFIIENEETKEQYKWIVLETQIDELPEGVTVEDEKEFLNSANHFEGYYQAVEDETKVMVLPIEEKWSPVYDKNLNYEDKNGDIAVIPTGFKVSRTPGMNTIDDGLVIQDEQGNEFVWVPVNEDNSFERRRGYNAGTLQSITGYGEADSTGVNSKFVESEATQKEAKAMYTSVEKNGGFYIGRYEAGKDSSGNLVCKKGVKIYNTKWGNSMTDDTGGAVELARNFANSKGYDTEKVNSTLCYSVQWDTALNFIDPGYTGYALDSIGKGWYKDNYNSTSTGNTETNTSFIVGKDLIYESNPTVIANMHKNIYDMGGNALEWTMESMGTSNRAYRGGRYNDSGYGAPASNRYSNGPGGSDSTRGFRIALYVEEPN